ncbi:PEP-CTERM sorting domain-containing protein [Poriferisphaera sp. WC338]|uniref:PEP-CTERM sorting domain-containing protein n=1 Tax=Poriferisphaera sp. WC338 TaxID=3425129 RepID=UPI003D812DCF
MKRILLSAAALTALPLLSHVEAATIVTGEMVENGSFVGANNTERYAGWTGWRAGGTKENLVFDAKGVDSNGGLGSAGFFSAKKQALSWTADTAITSVGGFDATTAMLTDIVLNDVSFKVSAVLQAGDELDVEFYVEMDVKTADGNEYRAGTNRISMGKDNFPPAGTLALGGINDWAAYGDYDGNPFDGGAGIALADITDITYKLVMHVITPNSDSTSSMKTVFLIADDVSATYTVEIPAIPEPASLALIGLGGLLVMARRTK